MRLLINAAMRMQYKQSKSNLYFSFASFSSSCRLADEIEEKLEGYTVIREGKAKILMNSNNSVFYNRAQVNNRDLSIAVLRTSISKGKEEHAAMLGKKLNQSLEEVEDISKGTWETNSWNGQVEAEPCRVLEALAASGLRSIRYALEVDGIGQVVALDRDKESVEACMKNIQLNGSVASSKVDVHLADARVYMLTHPKEFEAVDLDPYGSPSVFLDSAVQSVSEGGMLMCSATDLAVLCGTNVDVCYSRYGSYPLRGKYCHEMALRILLACIESHANRYKRFIVPVLSVYMDFYIRVFVRIFTSGNEMKNAPLKLSYVYQCVGCDSFHLQSLGRTTTTKNNRVRYTPGVGPVVPKECCDCGKKFHMGGPIWSAPIHDQEWVASILENVQGMKERYPAYKKISAVLRTVSEELADVPLFVSLHNMCATLNCTTPSAATFRSALTNAGYRVSGSHTTPLGFKTDAPMSVIWDIMRCWVKNHPVKDQQPGRSGTVILSKEPSLQANFSRGAVFLSKALAKRLARFPANPEEYWGPNIRAGRQLRSKHPSHLFPQKGTATVCHEEENGASRPVIKQETDTNSNQKEGNRS